MLKVTIDSLNNTCDFEQFDSRYLAGRVICSPESDKIYVLDKINYVIRMYNKAGGGEVWVPQGLVGNPESLAVNDKNIIIRTGTNSPVYVYDHNRLFLYTVSFDWDEYSSYFSHLTNAGLFTSTTGVDGKILIIFNLMTNTSLTVDGPGGDDGKFGAPFGVTAVGDLVIVADVVNERLCVFSHAGEFLRYIRFVGDDVKEPLSISVSPDNNYLAMTTSYHLGYDKVKVYRLG